MEYESLFTSAIEVGIGIAGFSGIVAVLGHRSPGAWTSADRGRMGILLQTSFATVLLSFLPLLLSGIIVEKTLVWSVCSGVYVAYTMTSLVTRWPKVRELRKDPTLRGQILLRLTIEPDGTVSLCGLQSSDMEAANLAQSVIDRVSAFQFGAKDVPAVTILYPIDFLPTA